MNKFYKPREVCQILGISYTTFFRYATVCTVCREHRCRCKCRKPKLRLKAIDFSSDISPQVEWRVSDKELRRYINSRRKHVRRDDSGGN